ncbi:MAG: ferritin-like domain-containing protein [Actinomycetota bacterium]|nr:ferritin-like domain-containing protein [Actinomycetota bacterium]
MSSNHFNLEAVDVDGAIRETAEEATQTLESEGGTRLDFFKKAGITGGALIGGGAVLGALVPGTALGRGPKGAPPSSFGVGDVGILNFALTLEYLERDFYIEATRNNRRKSFLNKGVETNFLKAVTADEKAHVKFLKAALGSAAIAKPKFDFGKTTRDRALFLETAYQLEDTGVGAYYGQAENIADPATLKAALSIALIEGRHAGVIGEITRGSNGIAPHGPFDRDLRADQVLKAVAKTGFIKG